MTNKKLSELVVEVSLQISEIYNHPEYQEFKETEHPLTDNVAQGYQGMVDLICEIEKKEKGEE
ncbi:MAG: hypothetical protein HWQ35_14255 [Nostoc sp. NMS1]|uniref:hypothetical protein n=1 Tax=unclassified Nostoc TaxID=2593658 RepID=UPI0025D944DF|nr:MULTISPECIES: hypothetical protein [unclassified Nostoc]MBN3907671.1 hypothetical protein [Nostoc sp. NMS1]MBN3992958.1 hypothetical protein [Nostoc sp. NMS2]